MFYVHRILFQEFSSCISNFSTKFNSHEKDNAFYCISMLFWYSIACTT
jgi:hypothetical protein